MTLPLVSVVIPCYNAERWIVETLESVRNQTWQNIEIIVVNDGSTDKSVDLIKSFEFHALRLIEQENKGQTSALNTGLAAARGDYIQYLDADDLLHPDKIEIQLKRLLANPDCIASAEWVRFYDKIDGQVFRPDDTWQDLEPVEWLERSWKIGGGMMYPAMWLLPINIVRNVGPWGEELSLNNDADYFVRAILASRRILFCPSAKTYYRSGIAGSLSGIKTEKGWKSQWKVLENCESYLFEYEESERTRKCMSLLWQRLAYNSYAYSKGYANEAFARAKKLHTIKLEPDGGMLFQSLKTILGWRAALVLQNSYYKFRYKKN